MENEKQRERLVELLLKCDKESEVLDCFNGRPTKKQSADIIAEYLLANNVVVVPCKVGDTVYSLLLWWDKESGIVPYQITNFIITENKNGEWTQKYRAMQLKNGKTIDWQLNFDFNMLGKTVFLTRAEAEAKLREVQK